MSPLKKLLLINCVYFVNLQKNFLDLNKCKCLWKSKKKCKRLPNPPAKLHEFQVCSSSDMESLSPGPPSTFSGISEMKETGLQGGQGGHTHDRLCQLAFEPPRVTRLIYIGQGGCLYGLMLAISDMVLWYNPIHSIQTFDQLSLFLVCHNNCWIHTDSSKILNINIMFVISSKYQETCKVTWIYLR